MGRSLHRRAPKPQAIVDGKADLINAGLLAPASSPPLTHVNERSRCRAVPWHYARSENRAKASNCMALRSIVKIDEDLCTGCGVCVTPCAEGAIEIIDGKAKVVKEELCDGAGFCLAVCPEGALTVEKRDAPEFDEDAAAEKMAEKLAASVRIEQKCMNCGRSEDDAVLFPARTKGESTWVCVKCLPALIHG
jgi:NAD-dependent dihydropyrimidine dehydrogenase PreA subunit